MVFCRAADGKTRSKHLAQQLYVELYYYKCLRYLAVTVLYEYSHSKSDWCVCIHTYCASTIIVSAAVGLKHVLYDTSWSEGKIDHYNYRTSSSTSTIKNVPARLQSKFWPTNGLRQHSLQGGWAGARAY